MNKADRNIFDEVGRFLAQHGLGAHPRNYTFAYHVIDEPSGPIAHAVRRITDGGIRLSRADVEALGGYAGPAMPVATPPSTSAPDRSVQAAQDATAQDDARVIERLMAQTQLQIEGFAATMRAMQAETHDFGEDLGASAAAMTRLGSATGDVARLTAEMIARVHHAEERLVAATAEADRLRAALAEARGSARRDPLTDLVNRRGFEEAVAAVPAGTQVIIGLCDVDHFKDVNDRFGHAVGDRVLKAIAQTLDIECGDHVVARHGGEEFAVLVTGRSREQAASLLEAARDAIAAKRYRLRDTDALLGVVTLSVGLAIMGKGETLAMVLDRADAALYQAKRSGRNQLCIAPDSGD